MVFAGCQCTSLGVDTTRFACGTNDDCIAGFECRDVGSGKECVRLGGDAGPGGGSGGGTGGGVGGGSGGGGVLASKLGFSSAPQTVLAATCSAALSVQTLDALDVPTNVNSDTPLTITFDAGVDAGVVAFFSAAGCVGSPTTIVTVPAGSSTTSFFARVDGPGLVDVTVSDSPLGTASQVLTVVTPPDSLAFTSMVPNPVRGGTCLPMTLEARAGGVAAPVAMNTMVALTVMPMGNVQFFSDSSCNQSIVTTTIAANTSLTSFFIKVLTGGAGTVTATAPFATANLNVNVTPMVRRGSCDFGTSQPLSDGGTQSATFVQCNVSPAITNLGATMLLTQATSTITAGENGTGLVRCRMGSNTSLQCVRRHDADPTQLHYQLVEIPTGLRTQRLQNTAGCGPTFTLNPAVDPTKTFILKSSVEPVGTFDDEETPVVELSSPTLVSVSPATCNSIEIQVIEWDGVTVERQAFDGGLPDGGLTRTVNMLPNGGTSRAVISQSGTTEDSNRQVCGTLVRASVQNPTQVDFSRAVGDGGCVAPELERLYFERIAFGNKAKVDEYTTTLVPGRASIPVSLNAPVDMSRTIVFASSQSAGGQGSGETDEGSTGNAGTGSARFVLLNATTVQVTRADSSSTAVFTFYVAELNP